MKKKASGYILPGHHRELQCSHVEVPVKQNICIMQIICCYYYYFNYYFKCQVIIEENHILQRKVASFLDHLLELGGNPSYLDNIYRNRKLGNTFRGHKNIWFQNLLSMPCYRKYYSTSYFNEYQKLTKL